MAHTVSEVVGARQRGGVRRALVLRVDEAERVGLAVGALVVLHRHTHQRPHHECYDQQTYASQLFNTNTTLLNIALQLLFICSALPQNCWQEDMVQCTTIESLDKGHVLLI